MKQIELKKETKMYLRIINEKIESYIKKSINYLSEEKGNLDSGSFSRKDLCGTSRCSEITQCQNMECPAYNSSDYRCWLIAGTMCTGTAPKGIFAQKYTSCYQCEVFKQFSDTELHRLHENIGILIRHHEDRVKQIKELAIKDSLTGLYNRHYLNIIREREVERLYRTRKSLSIVLFDLNRFKEINDTWGHQTGDETLKEFSAFLRKNTRAEDLLFRMGGDEFMVLMLSSDINQRKDVESRLLEGIKDWNRSTTKLPVQISFSLGGATGTNPVNFDSLMAEADRVLYQCKQASVAEITSCRG